MIFQLDEQAPVESQEVFSTTPAINIPANLDELSTQVGLVRASHESGDLEQATPRAATDITALGIDEVRRSIAAQEKSVEVKVAENEVRKTTDQDTMAYYQAVLAKHNGPPNKNALEEAVVDIITPKNAANYWNDYNRKAASKDLAARNILQETLNKNSESATFWDHILHFGKDIIPFVSSRALAKGVAEGLNSSASFADYFNTETIVNRFRSAFLNADGPKRKEMLQALAHGIEKYSSFYGDKNSATVLQHLNTVLAGVNEDQRFQTLMDIAGLPIATVLKVMARGAAVANEVGKPANVARKAGAKDLAAELMAKDAAEGTKVSGMTPAEIAKEAVSLNVTPFELSMGELKVGQSIQDKLRAFATKIRDNVKDTLQATAPSDEAITSAYNHYNELYSAARNKAIYQYTPTQFKDGMFEADIMWQTAEGKPFSTYIAAKQFGVENNMTGYATLVNPKPVVSDMPAVMRSNRVEKKYITNETPESEYLGRTIKTDEQGRPYFETAPTPSYGATAEVKEEWVFVQSAKNPLPNEAISMYQKGDVEGRNFFNFKIPSLAGSAEDVANRGLGMSANAKIRRDLESAYKDAITGVSKKELDSVYKALRDGDAISNHAGAKGHTFTQLELTARGMSEKAIESYYKHRIIRDQMWLLRNNNMRAELMADGMLEMAFDGNMSVGPLNRPAKPVLRENIRSQISNGRIGKVLDTKDGRVFQINSDDVDAIYDQGSQVVKLYKPERINGRQYTHLVVHQEDTRFTDVKVPVPYRPGELGRVYSDEYFIRMNHKTVDEFDNEVMAGSHIRTAPSAGEAKKFVEAMNKAVAIANKPIEGIYSAWYAARANRLKELEQVIGKYMDPEKLLKEVEEGHIPKDASFDFHYDRQSHTYMADTLDESIVNGRLFYSKRGDKLLSTDPTRENTLDIVDSLGVELANVSRYITSKDVRVDAIQRWMKTFGEGVSNRTFNEMMDFTEGQLNADLIKKALIKKNSELADVESDQLLKFAESSRSYIKNSLNLRTQQDKLDEARHIRMTEWLEGVMPKKVGEWFGPAMRKANVSDFLRAVNFNITLGLGNMTQLLVQANGMFVAAGIHPLHGIGAAKTAIPLRIALMSDNPNVWKQMATVDSLTSLGLKNVNEFVDIVKAIRKSGILADIKSTAMYNVEDGALNLYKNEFKSTFDKASPFFFNRGEEFSRLVSWEVARREWKNMNKGKDWTSDAALREISVRQKEFNLGMQSYNTTGWQRGWTGIPTQFLQYNIKLAAALMHSSAQLGKDINKTGWKAFTNFDNGNYRGFNPKQAAMLLASQIVLYGAAGNGLRAVADGLWGDTDVNMSEEQKMYISEGLAGGLVYTATRLFDGEPAKLALGKRLGSLEWYNDMYQKITTDKTGISDLLFGVTKSNGVKIIDVMADLARVFRYSDELTPDLLFNSLGKFPEVIASWSNATKAFVYMQNEGFVTSKDGTPIAQINTKENFAAFFGISSEQVQDYYNTVKQRGNFFDELTEIAKTVNDLQIRQWRATQEGNFKLADELEKMRWAIMPKDEAQRRFVMNEVKLKLWPGDSEANKIRREFLEQMNQATERFSVMDRKLNGEK